MTRRRKDPLRPLTDAERRELNRLRRSWTAPAVQVARAAALLLVSEGVDYQDAARAVGRKSGDAVSHLVARFNQEGLNALESLGLAVWCCDEAGPFQTVPQPGRSWRPEGDPARQPHEYMRNGTAKVLTLFHPADGRVRIEGVTTCPNAVLHPWLKRESSEVLAGLADPPPTAKASRAAWQRWQAGLAVQPTLPAESPPLRMLLVLDNLAGHKTPEFVLWLFAHGVMPIYTPVGGSWLNMAESIQRVLKRRALDGRRPATAEEIIAWLEAVARHWNAAPTPFEWGGKRAARRKRQRERRRRLGGSGAQTRRPVGRKGQRTYGHVHSK